MSRILIALGAFIGTISIIWVLSSPSGGKNLPSSLPQARQADIYLQSGVLPKKADPTSTPAPSPSDTLLIPQTLITPSSSPTPSTTTTSNATPTSTPTPVKSSTPTTTPTFTPAPSPTPTTTPTATPTPTNDSSTLEIKTFTSANQFARGSTYTITVQSSPNASCFLEISLPVTGGRSKSAGIWDSNADKPVTNTIDVSGSASWSWKVGSGTKLGFATVKATCNLGDQSATGQFQIEIIAAQ